MSEIDKQSLLRSSLESQDERFVVSSDTYSQERLRFVKQIGEELNSFSFYRCLTLKGSLSKGKKLSENNAALSDINMGCFLDAEEISRYPIDDLRKLCKAYDVNDKPDFSPIIVNEGKYNIFESQRLSSENLAKIRLARRIIEQFINKKGELYFTNSFFRPKIWPEIAIISEEGQFSIYSTLNEYNSSSSRSLEARVAVTRALSLPFGLIINGDLSSYIRTFFHELDNLDEETAEQKWQLVRKAIIENERWGSVNPTIDAQIPRNIEEARGMYLNKRGFHLK